LEAQQRLQEEGCVVDIKLFSGAIAGEVSS